MVRLSNSARPKKEKINPLAFVRRFLVEDRDDRNTAAAVTTTDVCRACYRLNLDDDDGCPDKDDDDNDTAPTPLQVAIETAQVFQGIVVGDDGIIVSQSDRANQEHGHLLGKTVEEGQSRQAVKIEQIVLATDTIPKRRWLGGRERSSPQPERLVVLGQYEHVDHLVSQGAEKLRKAKSLCWLPPLVMNMVTEFCATRDALCLSQTCRLMYENIKNCRNLQSRIRRIKRERKHKRSMFMKGRIATTTEKDPAAEQGKTTRNKNVFVAMVRNRRQKQTESNTKPG